MKQLLQKLKRQPKQSEVVDSMLLDENEVRKSVFDSAIKKTLAEEKFRFTTNFKIATTTTYLSLLLIMPFGLISWLMNLFGFVKTSPINILPWWFVLLLWVLPYVSWHYTTITIPQKQGPVIKRDWSKTPKGRKKAALYNLIPFHVMSWAVFSKYVYHNYFDYLTTLNVTEPHSEILLTDNLNSFLLILFVAPVIISGFAIFIQARDYMINKDLLEEHFMEWQMPYVQRFAHEYVLESVDVIVGYVLETGKPIVIKENERFLHEAIIGATGSGKTSTTLLLRIAQDLIKIATGVKDMGLVLLEPKGDAVDDVLTICKKLGIPDEKIVVIDPFKEMSYKYNPFIGERNVVANTFQGTISALTGDQDQFFKDQQNEVCKNITLLAKIRYGNKTNIRIIQQLIDDPRELANVVEHVSAFIAENRRNTNATPIQLKELDSYEVVVNYFINQVLDYKTYRDKEDIKPVPYPPNHRHHPEQMVENKKENYISGAKKYLNDLVNEDSLRALFTSGEDDRVFDADKFLSEGGIVLVNTALGELDELSMMFGQFFIRQFQAAVFRRAKESKEENIRRIPCIFYVDEFPLYANEAFERFLTLGRSYKVGAVIAMQSIAQLDAVGTDYRKTVMANASHKTVFGRGPVDDNEYFSKEFGEALQVEESVNESGAPMTTDNQSWAFRMNSQKKLMPRFTPTDIRELPFKQMIVQIVDERNSIAPPKHAIGEFVHESAFVQRFMKLVESDIKSTNERDLNVVGAISNSRNYIGKTGGDIFSNPEDNSNEEALTDFVSEADVVASETLSKDVTDGSPIELHNEFANEPVPIMEPILNQSKQPQKEYLQSVPSAVIPSVEPAINDAYSEITNEGLVNEAVPNKSMDNNTFNIIDEPNVRSEPIVNNPASTNEESEGDDWLDLLTDDKDEAANDETVEISLTNEDSVQEPVLSSHLPDFEKTDLSIGFDPVVQEPVSVIEPPVVEPNSFSISENAVSQHPISSNNAINEEIVESMPPVFEETNLSIGSEQIVQEPVISNESPLFIEPDLSRGIEPLVTGAMSIIEPTTVEANNFSIDESAFSQEGNHSNELPIFEETDLSIGFDEPFAEEVVIVDDAAIVEQMPVSITDSFVIQTVITKEVMSIDSNMPITAQGDYEQCAIDNNSGLNLPVEVDHHQERAQQGFETSFIDIESSDLLERLQKDVAASSIEKDAKGEKPIIKESKNDKPVPVEEDVIELEI